MLCDYKHAEFQSLAQTTANALSLQFVFFDLGIESKCIWQLLAH
jgi:hypothetical protein